MAMSTNTILFTMERMYGTKGNSKVWEETELEIKSFKPTTFFDSRVLLTP